MKGFASSFILLVLLVAFAAVPASANPAGPFDSLGLHWNWCPDPPNDSSPFGGSTFEIYGIGVAWTDSTIYVNVKTNFDPTATPSGGDSYGNNTFSAGDLYLNVGGSFQSRTGDVYGIATTSHGNEVTQAYSMWGGAVTAGELYSITDANENGELHGGVKGGSGDDGATGGADDGWASGTFEGYNPGSGIRSPGDGAIDGRNDYPTLIRYGDEVAGDNSSFAYTGPHGSNPKFDLWYSVDRAAIGLTCANDLQVFWAMECGNDGSEWNGEVPEPATIALISAGLAAMVNRKKNRHI